MGRLQDLQQGQAHLPFTRFWRFGVVLSIVLVLVSIGSLATRGLNLGIEFEGGTSWEYPSDQSVSEVRDVLGEFGLGAARIQVVNGDQIRIQAEAGDPAAASQVTQALAAAVDITSADVTVNVVGPTWGGEITESAIRAMVFFFVIVAAYMAVRLEWRMAVGSLVAVVHDIVIVVGVYSLFQFLVTPATVVAVLTIMGYSLYDTVVVFDRARENGARFLASGRLPYREVMELSLNQVLVRSINTTITTVLPVASLLLVGAVALGAETLQEFGTALAIGLVVGAYSSLFVAAPLVVAFKERESAWIRVRGRYEQRLATGEPLSDEPSVAAAVSTDYASPTESDLSRRELSAFNHPPRPRKGGRGKPRGG
jgi:preprotein translocase subunit SecF